MSDTSLGTQQLVFLGKLSVYFLGLGLLLVGMFHYIPLLLNADAEGAPAGEITRTLIEGLLEESGRRPTLEHRNFSSLAAVLGVLSFSFVLTIALMAPITWVYMHTHRKTYSRNLIASLIVLPICATATVWLIQDSLALAFGLAALVAAVRFRIRLDNELDGVYVFAAISVGLACGVGHFGVGYVMAGFFCFTTALIWIVGYGMRPKEEKVKDAGSAEAATAIGADAPVGPGRQ
ncbi:MAG: DUF4956 domain-containing protein [Steroidobacteraceae bacterium]|jgi:hypothetical protein|nr:DUF4956 domain-containing protein [Steroidobacteraceae bacterium]MCC7200135.1 DUF4956 domain-containing protein [Gammaproteobacteria bacterium]